MRGVIVVLRIHLLLLAGIERAEDKTLVHHGIADIGRGNRRDDSIVKIIREEIVHMHNIGGQTDGSVKISSDIVRVAGFAADAVGKIGRRAEARNVGEQIRCHTNGPRIGLEICCAERRGCLHLRHADALAVHVRRHRTQQGKADHVQILRGRRQTEQDGANEDRRGFSS